MSNRKPEPKVDGATLAFHHETLIFDCLSLPYVLDEPYAGRMHEAGVDATNLTVAAEEESWDDTLRMIETCLDKIEASPILSLATCSADVMKAKKAGKTAIILGTQG